MKEKRINSGRCIIWCRLMLVACSVQWETRKTMIFFKLAIAIQKITNLINIILKHYNTFINSSKISI